MNIQIKQHINNLTSNSDKLIQARIVSDTDMSDADISWGFEVTSQPQGSTVLHSFDAAGDVYLSYENNLQPLITLSLSEEGDYTVKLVAKTMVPRTTERSVISLDDDGNAIKSTKTVTVYDASLVKSVDIPLTYSTDNEWM